MPTVIAFKDGKQVNQFSKWYPLSLNSDVSDDPILREIVGALPEPHVKKFIEAL